MTAKPSSADTGKLPAIEILRTGEFVDANGFQVAFKANDLAEIAKSYDFASDPAPIVVGHPDADHPAYGWAEKLEVVGDRLLATPTQVDAQFAALVRAGRFKRVSSSLYHRTQNGNPTPGKFHLKHIGFLGAKAPAVKGLKPVSFSADVAAEALTLEFSAPEGWCGLIEPTKEKHVSDEQDKAAKAAVAQKVADDAKAIALSEREEALTRGEAVLEAQRKALADQAAKARKDQAISFCDGLVKAGKLAPHAKDKMAHVMGVLAGVSADKALAFGEGDKAETPLAVFQGILSAAKPIISFGEFAGAEKGVDDDAAPEVRAKRLAGAAQKISAEAQKSGNPISFSEAVAQAKAAGVAV